MGSFFTVVSRGGACSPSDGWMAAAKMRVFPTADGALQVQQFPCEWSSPGPADDESSVDVDAMPCGKKGACCCRVPKEDAVRATRRDGQGETALLGSPAVDFSRGVKAKGCPIRPRLSTVPGSCMHLVLSSGIVLGAGLDPGRARATGLRFVQCFVSCSSRRSPSSPSPSP